jgi:hypothetical protein
MSDDIKMKYRALIKRLYEKTKNGEIEWEIPWGDKVVCTVSGFEVELSSGQSGDGEPLEFIDLKDSNGRKIDSFADTFVGGEVTGIMGAHTYYDLMREIRQMGRRKAMGVDAAIDTILKDLS